MSFGNLILCLELSGFIWATGLFGIEAGMPHFLNCCRILYHLCPTVLHDLIEFMHLVEVSSCAPGCEFIAVYGRQWVTHIVPIVKIAYVDIWGGIRSRYITIWFQNYVHVFFCVTIFFGGVGWCLHLLSYIVNYFTILSGTIWLHS